MYMPPVMPIGSGTARDVELERVRTLARLLDHYLLDPLIGLLIPGGGDVLGSLLGMYIVMIAVRRKAAPVVIARMLMNLAADAAIGFIPLIGDLADIGFKANMKNVELLEQRKQGRVSPRDWLIVAGAALAFVVVIGFVVWGVVALVRAVANRW